MSIPVAMLYDFLEVGDAGLSIKALRELLASILDGAVVPAYLYGPPLASLSSRVTPGLYEGVVVPLLDESARRMPEKAIVFDKIRNIRQIMDS